MVVMTTATIMITVIHMGLPGFKTTAMVTIMPTRTEASTWRGIC